MYQFYSLLARVPREKSADDIQSIFENLSRSLDKK